MTYYIKAVNNITIIRFRSTSRSRNETFYFNVGIYGYLGIIRSAGDPRIETASGQNFVDHSLITIIHHFFLFVKQIM